MDKKLKWKNLNKTKTEKNQNHLEGMLESKWLQPDLRIK